MKCFTLFLHFNIAALRAAFFALLGRDFRCTLTFDPENETSIPLPPRLTSPNASDCRARGRRNLSP